MDRFFVRQLATYASYHRDARNRATHFIGIPAIVFSILVPLALLPLNEGVKAWALIGFLLPLGWFGIGVSWAAIIAVLAVLGWMMLDLAIGIAMIAFMLPALLIAEWIARSYGATTAWIVFAVFFVGGWIFQLIGHVWEGRRPALADNLFQAFIGPMFIMAEVLMALGFKRDLKAIIDHTPPAAA